jgi:hypothetical protein
VSGSRYRKGRLDEINMDNDYICFIDDNIDFSWKKKQVKDIIELIKKGATVELIADKYRRFPDEVFLLLLDLARKRKIDPDHNIFKLKSRSDC